MRKAAHSKTTQYNDRVRLALLVGSGLVVACGGKANTDAVSSDGAAAVTERSTCPAAATAPSPLPKVEPAHRTLAYWLERTSELDDVVLDPRAIRDMNASLAVERGPDWHGEYPLGEPLDPARMKRDIADRLSQVHKKLVKNEYVEADGTAIKPADIALFDPGTAETVVPAPQLRVALDALPLRCGPRAAGFFTAAPGTKPSTRYDRNNCSTAHPQEVVQVVAEWPNGMRLARTRYAFGWITKDAKLSPPIPEALQDVYLRGARAQADEELALQITGKAAQCPEGTLLPITGNRVHFANASGFEEATVADGRALLTQRPLTRRALFTEAFRFLDSPYGWGGGGTNGGHDCSSFLMDLFAGFDIHLPRHSSWQARAGTFSIDVSKMTAEDERTRLIDAAAKKGVVLLSFPGHIMLYLGRSDRGTPMVMHAIAEYVVPCAGGGETINQNDKISVSDLELGRGSSRKSLLERITSITVIGKAPGIELAGAAELRPAALVEAPEPKACKDSEDVAIFASPRTPNATQAMRVIVTANHDLGAASLALFDPKGERIPMTNLVRLSGGPPWSVLATVDKPLAGAWTAVYGDGARVDACKRITVAKKHPGTYGASSPAAYTWGIRRGWTRATENLYAAFVQRLFDFPADQDLTWPNLHTLLRDPAKNILFDHLQKGEERLALEPDCADLPYLLRAYFSWKMGLPFAYHRCNRGSATRAPVCVGPPTTNLMKRDLLDDKPVEIGEVVVADEEPEEVEETDGIEETTILDVNAFHLFWSRHVSRGVHAASGRTVPGDDLTDYYPVPLTREWLKPGTVYHDPFGHVMVIAAWIPQSTTSYGMLLAADAQPDGTVGRKRFWRGNFLFVPETKVSGAGFKAFRPALYGRGAITLMKNSDLKRTRTFAPFSDQQYQGTADKFHDTVEGLINPRPLDPSAALGVLVDSLHSSAKLRIVSVKNGEEWIAQNPGRVMPMPDGADIFLTSGAWEDFATPSRDFRLLIAIDTVLDFPAAVRRSPARFALQAKDVDATITRLEQELEKALAARSIEYTRSDGKTQTVTLKELVDRRAGFEVSYNPNDCIEHRWAAPEGSAERASCRRRAPDAQQAKLAKYRSWFQKRQRPSR